MKIILIAFTALALLLAGMSAQGDLSILSEYQASNWQQFMEGIPGISGPGVVVSGVPISDDTQFLSSVQEVLDQYAYDKQYRLEDFDCTNSSQIAWYILKQKGFDAKLMYNNEIAIGRKDKGAKSFFGHVWVMVPKQKYQGGDYQQYVFNGSGGWVAVETTEDYSKHLGLAYAALKKDSWFNSNDGWLFNSSREYSMLTGDYYELGLSDLPIKKK